MHTKANIKRIKRGEKPKKYKFKDFFKSKKNRTLVPILTPPPVPFRNMDDVIR